MYENSILSYYGEQEKLAYQNFISQPQSNLREYYVKQMIEVRKYTENGNPIYIEKTLDEILAQDYFDMAQ